MDAAIAILWVLSPGILYAFALVTLALKQKFFKDKSLVVMNAVLFTSISSGPPPLRTESVCLAVTPSGRAKNARLT